MSSKKSCRRRATAATVLSKHVPRRHGSGLPNPNFKKQEFLAKKSGVDQEIFIEKSGEKPGDFYRSRKLFDYVVLKKTEIFVNVMNA
jgi:hypothetical protein